MTEAMNEKRLNAGKKNAEAEPFDSIFEKEGLEFKDASDAYEYLTGKRLTREEATEAIWYDRLRRRLVAARKDKKITQAEAALTMETTQSEISRIENSLGPGTQLGTLVAFCGACGLNLATILGSNTQRDDEALIDPSQAQPAFTLGKIRLMIEGQLFEGAEAVGIVKCLHAINGLLIQMNTASEERKEVILGFLAQLKTSRPAVYDISKQDVLIDIHDLPSTDPGRVLGITKGFRKRFKRSRKVAAEDYEEFVENIAGPLQLKEF